MHVLGKKSWRTGSGSLPASWTTRQISRLLVALVVIPLGGTVDAFSLQAPAAPPANAPAPQNAQPLTTEVASSSLLLADPSAEATPDAPQPQNAPPPSPQQNNAQPQSSPQQQQQPGPQQPLGTAAAPYEQPNGITASRPAGAAIAPAKQRRTRTLFIRVGVLVAAAAAIGTVMALSSASPSTPH